eukprot:scaffold7689_cov62-Phaeocystis_antarctica.AAC.2
MNAPATDSAPHVLAYTCGANYRARASQRRKIRPEAPTAKLRALCDTSPGTTRLAAGAPPASGGRRARAARPT